MLCCVHLIVPSLTSSICIKFTRKMTHYVFVYGTLKRGEPNHSWLTKNDNGKASFVCAAKTSQQYPLVIATRYNIPFLLLQPGMGHYVQGEVYKVDDQMLSNLDILEQHPDYYTRTVEELRPIGGQPSESIDCWVYFLQRFKPNLLQLPFLEDYSSKGAHGLEFAESNNESSPADLDEEVSSWKL